MPKDSRIAAIRRDIVKRLKATGEFNDVYRHLPENFGRGASDINAAAVEVSPGKAADRWDGRADGSDGVAWDNEERIPVVVMARNQDPELRDDEAEGLVQVLRDALNGQPLAGIVVADKTLVESWTPLPEKHPERRYRCIVRVEYIDDGPSNPAG